MLAADDWIPQGLLDWIEAPIADPTGELDETRILSLRKGLSQLEGCLDELPISLSHVRRIKEVIDAIKNAAYPDKTGG